MPTIDERTLPCGCVITSRRMEMAERTHEDQCDEYGIEYCGLHGAAEGLLAAADAAFHQAITDPLARLDQSHINQLRDAITKAEAVLPLPGQAVTPPTTPLDELRARVEKRMVSARGTLAVEDRADAFETIAAYERVLVDISDVAKGHG